MLATAGVTLWLGLPFLFAVPFSSRPDGSWSCGRRRLSELGRTPRCRGLHQHGGDHVRGAPRRAGGGGGRRAPLLRLRRRALRQHIREQQRARGHQLRAAREQGGDERPRGARHEPPPAAARSPLQGEDERNRDRLRRASLRSSCRRCYVVPQSFCTPRTGDVI
ncbi:hypothetical protein SETIT_7G292400v2 [Setaria italica]|uniref:Uncharacterized protein n=1 Tax=Setaria italica TaxID=4555 RepID=A0A368S114_SETIT|nr:hypothetical protein SETIT_7G292400v2 [Setaria italica]